MDKQSAIAEIKSSWKRLYPADKDGNGIVCPLCGNGSGRTGDGIKGNAAHNKPNSLKCFVCDFSGDVIDLIQKETGADFNAAVNRAAADLGITIDDNNNAVKAPQSQHKSVNDKTTIRDIKTPVQAPQSVVEPLEEEIINYTEYYKQCKARIGDKKAVSYLMARGISADTALNYNIGYDDKWISPTTIKRLAAEGNEWRPQPTARIIIPVTKNHYIARAVDASVKKEFTKMNENGGGSTGIFNATALYKDNEAVFVTEGAFDALSIIEAGAAAIALNSTANTGLLLEYLGKHPTTATLILCLDNDKAGRAATEKLQEGLKRLNIGYITADIAGEYKDANEALVGNKSAFIEAVQKTQAQTAAKPDDVSSYIDNLLQVDIDKMRGAAERKTGFDKLDELSGGLYPGLYVIAATSSLGKTTFSHQIADNLAAAGNDVLFFSMEQSRLELVSKSIARLIRQGNSGERVTSLMIRKGYSNNTVTAAINKYKGNIADRLSIVEGNFNCNISFIGDYIRRYIRRNKCKPVIFIDYLQILQPAEEMQKATTKETIDSTVTELKRISREQDLTVFIISSVNRANYLTPIDFESLKESGGIEYTADVIWGLQLECLNSDLFSATNKIKDKRDKIKEAKAADPRKIELVCLKNRYGVASYNCYFDYFPASDYFMQNTEERKKADTDNKKYGKGFKADTDGEGEAVYKI